MTQGLATLNKSYASSFVMCGVFFKKILILFVCRDTDSEHCFCNHFELVAYFSEYISTNLTLNSYSACNFISKDSNMFSILTLHTNWFARTFKYI